MDPKVWPKPVSKSNLISILVILPEVNDFNNRKICDNINSGASSEPVITDSLSQPLEKLRYLDRKPTYQQVKKPVIAPIRVD